MKKQLLAATIVLPLATAAALITWCNAPTPETDTRVALTTAEAPKTVLCRGPGSSIYGNITAEECLAWQEANTEETADHGLLARKVPMPTHAGAPLCTSEYECSEKLGEDWNRRAL